tara:strand:+ start:2603 stop:3409 length:807 start_codon:yes stop_codon:yes gene_type:complete
MRNHLLRAASANVSSGIVTTNLIAHYDFGNSSSYSGSGNNNDTVTDLTGNNNDAVLVGDNSTFSTNTANGGYLEMNHGGSSSIGTIQRDTNLLSNLGTDDFTLEFWIQIKNNGQNTYYDLLFIEFPSSPSNSRFILSGSVYYSTFNGEPGHRFASGASWEALGSTVLYDSTSFSGWMHLVYSRTGTGTGDVKFYKNNTLQGTGTNATNYGNYTSFFSSNDRKYFGIGFTSNVLRLIANLAIFRFYSGTGLTAAQVQQNYNTDKARFGL